LKLKCDEPFSNVAFDFKLRRYNLVTARVPGDAVAQHLLITDVDFAAAASWGASPHDAAAATPDAALPEEAGPGGQGEAAGGGAEAGAGAGAGAGVGAGVAARAVGAAQTGAGGWGAEAKAEQAGVSGVSGEGTATSVAAAVAAAEVEVAAVDSELDETLSDVKALLAAFKEERRALTSAEAVEEKHSAERPLTGEADEELEREGVEDEEEEGVGRTSTSRPDGVVADLDEPEDDEPSDKSEL